MWRQDSANPQVRRRGIGRRAERPSEEPPQHERVPDRVVAVVVVEGDEDLLGLLSDPPDLGDELPELRLAVEVVVLLTHGRLLPSELAEPSLGVPPVQTEHGARRGRGRHARHRAGGDRRVDDHVGEPRSSERRERLGRVLGEPRAMAELDRDREARQALNEGGEVVEPRGAEANPRRELEEDVAELPRLGQRCHGRAEEPHRGVHRLGRKARGLDLAAPRPPGLPGQEGHELRREALGLRVVPRQQRVGLDVEDEPGGRALDPADGVADVGNRVVRAVHLDGVEDARVIAQARLRRHGPPRIEAAALDERRIRPGADPDSHALGGARRSFRRCRVG